MAEAPSTPARRPWSLLLVCLVPLLALTWRFDFLCDDAYITFVYARNLAEGRGLVYNPGEWVEGYSEFLWALVLAAGQLVGISPLVLSRVLSVAAALVLAHLTTRLIAERFAQGAPVSQHGAAFFLGCLPPLAVWSTSGLATLPFSAAVVGLFFLTWLRERPAAAWKLGLVASVAALLRADGAWWVAFVLGPAILSGLAARDSERWRPALVGAGISAGVFAAHVGWRLITYGDWLPHTARVKVGFSAWALERGNDYLMHFLLTFPGVILALGIGLLALRSQRVLPALVLVGATALYAVITGGDFMCFGRFLVPMLPFIALALAAGLARLERRWGPAASGAGAVACVVLVLTPAFNRHVVPAELRTSVSVRHNRGDESRRRSEVEQWRNMRFQAHEWSTLGEALALVSQPGDSLVYGAVGAIGWTSRLRMLDRNGLITPSVAKLPAQLGRSPGHDKTVPPEFFEESAPTYLFALWLPDGEGTWQECVGRTGVPMLVNWLNQGRLERIELPPGEHPYPGNRLLVVRGR